MKFIDFLNERLEKTDKYTITQEKFPTTHIKIKTSKTYSKPLEAYLKSKNISFKQYTKGYGTLEYHLIGTQDFDKIKADISTLSAKDVIL
jgi:translation elongation factor EF-4